jgi:hypothetical protein
MTGFWWCVLRVFPDFRGGGLGLALAVGLTHVWRTC